MFLGIVDLELLKVCIAVENLLVIRDAVILNPSGRTDQTIWKPANVSLPVTNEEVEVVGSVAQRAACADTAEGCDGCCCDVDTPGAGDSCAVDDNKLSCSVASK